MLSVTTDYITSLGCPEPYLKQIAETGFTHIHWCHQWNTDFVYAECEIGQIAAWMKEYNLSLTDLHGSMGEEKCWVSYREYERQAGVELVKNRIEMTARLGGDVVIMHASDRAEQDKYSPRFYEVLWRSLDELEPFAASHGVRLAIENDPFPVIREVLARYGPDYVGLCYDSGHGNLIRDGIDQAEALKDRLLSVHLHDNAGEWDEHQPPFSGTADWTRIARMLATSSYTKCVSMEVARRDDRFGDEEEFLQETFNAGKKLSALVERERQGTCP